MQPRAGQVLALAMHQLAVNAVEHGALGANKGSVEVSWNVASTEPGTPLLLSWIEFNQEPTAEPVRHGFGTEVLTRMLPYELKAETDISFGSGGLRWMVCFALLEQVGRIASN